MNLVQYMENYCPFWLQPFIKDNIHHIQCLSNLIEQEEKDGKKVTPSISKIFSTFYLVSLDTLDLFPNSIKVVFLFQDVYPKPGAACGIATCTTNGHAQETLKNIFKRLKETYKIQRKYTNEQGIDVSIDEDINTDFIDGDIRGWCSQGVLLWNVGMTTIENEIGSHIENWSLFCGQLIKYLSETYPYLVFVLFGKEAQKFKSKINSIKHDILTTSHPAGRGYFHGFHESDIFNQVNNCLERNLRPKIQWQEYRYIDRM